MTEQSTSPAWIALPSAEDLITQQSPNRPAGYNFGFVSGMRRLLMAHDRIGPAVLAAFAQIMFAPGLLTRREREMIAAVTAAAQDCHY
jgi:hypothetical protein